MGVFYGVFDDVPCLSYRNFLLMGLKIKNSR